ncbi:MAG: DDE-type integrase/transposase/recombinase, partial [Candidatus Bathyarchaeia archaeon]
MNAFTRLLEAIKANRLFKRNKVSLEDKVWAIIFYLAGLSLRAITERYGLIKASKEAVRLWVHRLEALTYHGSPKNRRTIAIDETKTKLNGKWLYLWAAIDVDTKEILAVYASWERSGLDAYLFLKMVLKACSNKPLILVDKGVWYPWALSQLSLEWLHLTFGKRNAIERYFRTLKERLKGFYNNINAKSLLAVNAMAQILAYGYN